MSIFAIKDDEDRHLHSIMGDHLDESLAEDGLNCYQGFDPEVEGQILRLARTFIDQSILTLSKEDAAAAVSDQA
jgi:hypothetical protein